MTMPPDALPANEAAHSNPLESREEAMEAVLTAVGELGYRETSVQSVLERSGWHRVQFYRHFENKEDCFAQAYGAWMDRLGIDLLKAAATAPGWEASVRAALVELFRFVAEEPAIARALFVEVQIAGEPAMARHEAAAERFAAAIDTARERIAPELAPPEETGAFVVGGIESCICEALTAGDPERIWRALPELMHFAAGSYFGGEAASAAFEEASEWLQRQGPLSERGAG